MQKVDYIFKNLFGSEKHPRILISFLNACIKPESPIVSVRIKNREPTCSTLGWFSIII
ncbi:MAG: PD-(D/E)XK nuclease family transposase [Cetobacterium sp.]